MVTKKDSVILNSRTFTKVIIKWFIHPTKLISCPIRVHIVFCNWFLVRQVTMLIKTFKYLQYIFIPPFLTLFLFQMHFFFCVLLSSEKKKVYKIAKKSHWEVFLENNCFLIWRIQKEITKDLGKSLENIWKYLLFFKGFAYLLWKPISRNTSEWKLPKSFTKPTRKCLISV